MGTLKSIIEGIFGIDDVPVPAVSTHEELGNYLRRREKYAKKEAKVARQKAIRKEIKAREKEALADLFGKIADITRNNNNNGSTRDSGGSTSRGPTNDNDHFDDALEQIKVAIAHHNAIAANNNNSAALKNLLGSGNNNNNNKRGRDTTISIHNTTSNNNNGNSGIRDTICIDLASGSTSPPKRARLAPGTVEVVDLDMDSDSAAARVGEVQFVQHVKVAKGAQPVAKGDNNIINEKSGAQAAGADDISSTDDGEARVVAEKRGVQALKDFAHARPDCGVHSFKEDPLTYCTKCFCVVCETGASECRLWKKHAHKVVRKIKQKLRPRRRLSV